MTPTFLAAEPVSLHKWYIKAHDSQDEQTLAWLLWIPWRRCTATGPVQTEKPAMPPMAAANEEHIWY